MGIGGILCYFFLNIYVLFFLFFIISIGCAMLEPTTEAYFMDTNSKKEIDEFYGIYNTTIDIFYSLSAFFAALILLFFDFKFLFIFYGSILFLFGLITLFLKDFVEYPEAEK